MDKATSVEDILKVQNSLSQIRQQIEQIKGQMLYLERTSAMSLISVSLQPEAAAQSVSSGGWSGLAVLKAALRTLIEIGKVLLNLVIFLVILSPIWGVTLWVIWYIRRRRKAARAAKV